MKYKTAVLLHWNAEKQREETWLCVSLSRNSMWSPGIAKEIAAKELGYQPLVVVNAATYLNGKDSGGSRHWLAGPLSEEEAARL